MNKFKDQNIKQPENKMTLVSTKYLGLLALHAVTGTKLNLAEQEIVDMKRNFRLNRLLADDRYE